MKAIEKNKGKRSIAILSIVLVFAAGINPTTAAAAIESTIAGHNRVNQPKLYKVTTGIWGATGAEMAVEKSSVKLTFDCANGEIPLTLKRDRKGNFKVEGTYTRRGFGPVRINNPPTSQPVIYEGKVSGRSMKFTITMIGTNEILGEFTVTRGQEAKIRGCR